VGFAGVVNAITPIHAEFLNEGGSGILIDETSAQAAEALRPLAGAFAETIFALGIVGTGLLAP